MSSNTLNLYTINIRQLPCVINSIVLNFFIKNFRIGNAEYLKLTAFCATVAEIGEGKIPIYFVVGGTLLFKIHLVIYDDDLMSIFNRKAHFKITFKKII